MQAIFVMTAVGSQEQADLIARELVERRQAACVNIVPGIRSVYRWKGEVCQDGELLLIIKTLAAELEGVMATIRELHGYELPEVVSFAVDRGEPTFLDWIAASVRKGEEKDEERAR